MKNDIFNTELNYIKDEKIKESTKIILNLLPEYFYHIPASSTGKYHPQFSLGEGGLVRHVKAAIYFAEELLNNVSTNNFNEHEKDLIRMAIILHDGLKKGLTEETYTRFDHPLLMQKFITDNIDKLPMNKSDAIAVGRMISTHMGPWTKDHFGNDILPKPEKADEKFVHLCDYLASRREINVNFDNNEIHR